MKMVYRTNPEILRIFNEAFSDTSTQKDQRYIY